MYVFLSNPKCWFYFTKSFTCCFYHGLLMLLVLEKWKNHIPICTVCECDSLSIILIGLCQPKWSQCVFKMISTLTWKRLTSTMTQKHSCHFLIFSGVNKRVWITKTSSSSTYIVIPWLPWSSQYQDLEHIPSIVNIPNTSIIEDLILDYTLQIVCIFFVCEEANKTLNYLRLIANKANKIQRPIKIKIKASIKVPPALKRHFC